MNAQGHTYSEYELARLDKIARNNAHLKSLGLEGVFSERKKMRPPSKKPDLVSPRKRPAPAPAPAAMRRSSRNSGNVVDYTGTLIIADIPPGSKRGRKAEDSDEDEDEDSDNEEEEKKLDSVSAIALSLDAIKSAIPASFAFPKETADAIKDLERKGASSHAQAIRRWGPSVTIPSGTSWDEFLESRLSSPLTSLLPSPYGLLQEKYAADGWRLLVSCVLMSRVSSHVVKERCIRTFFELCPTPSALSGVDPNELEKCIHSLGMSGERIRSVSAITVAWLSRGSFDVNLVTPEKGGSKIFGCGAFTVDSYNLFCKCRREYEQVSGDHNIVTFQKWLQKQLPSNKN